MTKTKNKPSNIEEVSEYFSFLPRAKERFAAAVSDDIIAGLNWNTLRALAFACRDPKTTAKEMTLSQKVMMYRRYDKLWASICEATRLYGSRINEIKCQPEVGEDVAEFRKRYLQAIIEE